MTLKDALFLLTHAHTLKCTHTFALVADYLKIILNTASQKVCCAAHPEVKNYNYQKALGCSGRLATPSFNASAQAFVVFELSPLKQRLKVSHVAVKRFKMLLTALMLQQYTSSIKMYLR